VEGEDRRPWREVIQLIVEVWGKGTALGVAEAVLSWHGGRGHRGENRILVFASPNIDNSARAFIRI